MTPGTVARVNWPGAPLHGKRCVVEREVTIPELDLIGRLFACRFADHGSPIALRESQLIPIDARPIEPLSQLSLF